MKKFISMLVTVVLMCTTVIPAFATGTLKPTVEVLKFNTQSQQYDLPGASATSGDLLLVRVRFNETVPSLASLRIKLEFQKDLVSYVEGSVTGEIVAGNPNAGSPIFTSKDGYLVTLFSNGGTSGDVEIANNVTNVVSFIFHCIGSEGAVEFKATMDNALDKSYKDISFAVKVATAQVSLTGWSLSTEDRAIFEKLKNITPTAECKTNIDAADTKFGTFTATEQLQFKNKYPDLFTAYQNAWTNYYNAMQSAAQSVIDGEIAKFRTDYAAALALKPEDVNDSNYMAIIDVDDAYTSLSPRAKVGTVTEKLLIASLLTKAVAVEAAQKEFIESFTKLWEMDETTIIGLYKEVQVEAAKAQAAYKNLDLANMPEVMKAKIEPYHSKLTNILATVAKIAKEAGEESTIMGEITSFTEKWYKVIRLNSLSVGIGDESAIKMMLEDYENLSDIAKTRLGSQKSMATQMLAMINEFKSIQGDDPDVITVPSGGDTVEVIKEVQVTVPVEVEKVMTKINTQIREIPALVKVMAVLMCVAVISMFVPIGIYLVSRKKQNI